MAHCFSIVDNFDGKFVKAIIELPFTGEFLTDRGKRSCVQVRFRTFFMLVIRIKMHVWVLFRLQIESAIRSEKDFTSANMFIEWNDSAMNFWENFFPNLELLNSGCGLSASVAYTPVCTVIHLIISVWLNGTWSFSLSFFAIFFWGIKKPAIHYFSKSTFINLFQRCIVCHVFL